MKVPGKKLTRNLLPGMALTAMSMTSFCSYSQTTGQRPGLVIGITVEGLQWDYLNLLRDKFGDDGLGYILENATTLTDVDFGTCVDGPTANAIIYTGAAPVVNGIGSETIYNTATHRIVPTLNCDSPSAAEENFSPTRLLASTLTDEIKIEGAPDAQAHSVAANPSMAITAAGHAANSAFWINDASGRWTTSTFYQDRPAFLQYRNRMQPLEIRLDTMTWQPMASTMALPYVPAILKEYPFRVHFPYNDNTRLTKYKHSPKSNEEVTSVATEYLTNFDLGKNSATDFLAVAYTVQPYPYGKGGDERLQTIDSYLRLDRELDKFFKTVEENSGLENTLIFIAGTPVTPGSRNDDEKWRIPSGEFSVRKATSLLNLFLINKFGNGDWISGYHNGYFYLNPSTISEHKAEEKDVRREAAGFLRKMAGISYAYTIDDVIDRRVHDNAEAMSRNTNSDTSGDIFIITQPGWKVVDQHAGVPVTELAQRGATTTAPFFLISPGVTKSVINTPVDARSIAPTVASILRIRAPNGASQPPLRL